MNTRKEQPEWDRHAPVSGEEGEETDCQAFEDYRCNRHQ